MPKWRPNCFRGSIYSESPRVSVPGTSIVVHPEHTKPSEWTGSLVITLTKREGCSLGLTMTGGSDKGQTPHISSLRPGSVAHRCDALMQGDVIVSVNEIQTCGLRHEEIINLLKNAGVNVTLEIEYAIPNKGPPSPGILVKQHEVKLDREASGFGLTLRGGMLVDSMRPHPFSVVSIRAGGPAHREGSIRIGDQVVAVNGCQVAHLSLGEVLAMLAQCQFSASFAVTYETAVMEALETSTGPLEIEIDRCPNSDIGVTLCSAMYQNQPCLSVEYIQPMSLADRSGALHEGDHILSIDGVSVEGMSLAEGGQLLKAGPGTSIRLQIVSNTHLEHCASRDILSHNGISQSHSSQTGFHPNSNSNSNNNIITNNNNCSYNSNSLIRGFVHQHKNQNSSISGDSGGSGSDRSQCSSSHLNSESHRVHSFNGHSCVPGAALSASLNTIGTHSLRKQTTPARKDGRRTTSCLSIASSCGSVLSNPNQVCHAEMLEVILFTDHRGTLGLTLQGGSLPGAQMAQAPSIVFVEPRSPAYKCGVLQEGDRIVAVNGMDTVGRTLDEVNRYMRDSQPRCVLLVEFDVTESVIPSSGTFIVKLAKRAGETGITINGCTSTRNGQDSLFVSDVRRGSVAHRSGSIQAGDKLLAINDVRLNRFTTDDAAHLLELPDDIVKLKLSRDDPDEGNEGFIVYTVELQRYGGALGITISGTEDPYDPIIISELTPDGLAEKTGAIHIGDRLLAVSGDTTKNKPLSEAIRMLQSAGDVVTLKIARPDPSSDKLGLSLATSDISYSTPIPSVDSAMESCDSSALDFGSPHHNGYDHDLANDSLARSASSTLDRNYRYRNKAAGDVTDVSNGWYEENLNHSHLPGDASDYQLEERCCSKDGWRNKYDNSQSDLSRDGSHMEDWVKTLEELDIATGSEMLQQIGHSLRQRSELNLDATTNSLSPPRSQSKSIDHLCDQQASFSDSQSKHFDIRTRDLNRTITDVYATPIKKSSQKPPAIPKKPSHLVTSKSSSLPPRVNPPSLTSSFASPSNATSVSGKENQTKTIFTPSPVQLQKIVVEKDEFDAGFGFSVSDSMYGKGVFISAVNKDSCAARAGLKQYDRLLQVGKVKVQDLDCREVIPLIAESGIKLNLIVCRNPLIHHSK